MIYFIQRRNFFYNSIYLLCYIAITHFAACSSDGEKQQGDNNKKTEPTKKENNPPSAPVESQEKGFCGDNKIDYQSGEVCDGTTLNGLSCESFGYTEGTLKCLDDCTAFDLQSCIRTEVVKDYRNCRDETFFGQIIEDQKLRNVYNQHPNNRRVGGIPKERTKLAEKGTILEQKFALTHHDWDGNNKFYEFRSTKLDIIEGYISSTGTRLGDLYISDDSGSIHIDIPPEDWHALPNYTVGDVIALAPTRAYKHGTNYAIYKADKIHIEHSNKDVYYLDNIQQPLTQQHVDHNIRINGQIVAPPDICKNSLDKCLAVKVSEDTSYLFIIDTTIPKLDNLQCFVYTGPLLQHHEVRHDILSGSDNIKGIFVLKNPMWFRFYPFD